MVLDNLLPVKRLREIDENGEAIKHVAINIADILFLEKLFKEKKDEAFSQIVQELEKRNSLIKNIIELQVKNSIPIVTLYITGKQHPVFFSKIYEVFNELLQELKHNSLVSENNIRVTFLGKWYDLPSNTIDHVKQLSELTSQNEKYFLNFCLNYDGQQEIVDAARVVAHKIKLGKIEPQDVTIQDLKQNIYLSQFSSPDRIVTVSKKRKFYGFLLWDSVASRIYFVDKQWNEVTIRDLEKYFQ
jgi:undecaprenyl diphosphate synthase